MHEIKKKLGAKLRKEEKSSSNKLSNSKFLPQHKRKLGVGTALPRSYDPRQRYPKCGSISHIRDQSYCGSCWVIELLSKYLILQAEILNKVFTPNRLFLQHLC